MTTCPECADEGVVDYGEGGEVPCPKCRVRPATMTVATDLDTLGELFDLEPGQRILGLHCEHGRRVMFEVSPAAEGMAGKIVKAKSSRQVRWREFTP